MRLCVAAQSAIDHFYQRALNDLIEAIRGSNSADQLLKMKADFAYGTYERLWNAAKKTPKEWLGPNNIPGSPEQRKQLAWAKGIFEKATGEKL